MQADKNVLTLKEEEKEKLEDPDDLSENQLNFLIGESEAFTSDDYAPFLDELKEQDNKYGILTLRDNQLLQGCLLKEQEIRNLINLGLGGLLRELKRRNEEKAQNDDLHPKTALQVDAQVSYLLSYDLMFSKKNHCQSKRFKLS